MLKNRRELLSDILQDVDENERVLVDRLLDEIVFLEERMTELKKMPFISVHPKKPTLQKVTPAAKLYKECSQSYMNAIRILESILRKTESSEQDDLLKRLDEFMAL